MEPEKGVPILDGGRTACPGIGSGPVFLVRGDDYIDRFPPGCVLVARDSSPAFSRLMTSCRAIVTDVGSPIGHMAILAREYQVPAIVGLEGATKLLETGRVVTVNATTCQIHDGEIPHPNPSQDGPCWPIPPRSNGCALEPFRHSLTPGRSPRAQLHPGPLPVAARPVALHSRKGVPGHVPHRRPGGPGECRGVVPRRQPSPDDPPVRPGRRFAGGRENVRAHRPGRNPLCADEGLPGGTAG